MESITGIYNIKGYDSALLHGVVCDDPFDPVLGITYSDANFTLFCRQSDHINDVKAHLIIAGEAVLFNKEELKGKLSFSGSSDLELVLESFKCWGTKCVNYLVGDFAFAVYDAQNNTIFSARDPFGQKPFYYCVDNELLCFSNNLKALVSFPFASREIDEDWIIDFFMMYNSFKEQTIYRKIKRLSPGTSLSLKKWGTVHYNKYWDLNNGVVEQPKTIDEATERLSDFFYDAVKSRLTGQGKIGIELSGGIDSTSIAAVAQSFLVPSHKSLFAFSNVLPEEYKSTCGNFKDEWQRASTVAQYLGMDHHIGISAAIDDPATMCDRVLDKLGFPTNSYLIILQQGIYKAAAEQGVHTLLSGFGGNELVSENANTSYINELLRKNRIFKLGNYFNHQDNDLVKSYTRSVYHYARHILNKDRKLFANKVERKFDGLILSDDLSHNINVRQYFSSNAYSIAGKNIREKNIYRLSSGITDERIHIGNLLALDYGIRYSYPLLDTRLMHYYYHLPDEWKASSKLGRAFMRRMMNGKLPAEILQKPKTSNSSTTPFYKVDIDKNFYIIKNWCLSLSKDHMVFDYVSRQKIENLIYEPSSAREGLKYMNFMVTIMMAKFLDKIKERKA